VDCDALRDDQWGRLEAFVPGGRKGKRGPRTNNRRFLNALLWIMADDRLDDRAGASPRRWRSPAKRGADAQGLGRSRGGLSTKIHAAGDALGNPVRLIGSPGQRNDIAFAHELVEGLVADVIIADKGYDADHLCDRIAESGGQPVIPPKRNRTFKRPYDAELYKERNTIERFFNKLKQFRGVAARYDKLLANFMGFVKLAAIAIWLK
jgi:putative transposase